MALIAACLMGFDAILHPKGARLEDVRDETRRKRDAKSGETMNDTEKQGL